MRERQTETETERQTDRDRDKERETERQRERERVLNYVKPHIVFELACCGGTGYINTFFLCHLGHV